MNYDQVDDDKEISSLNLDDLDVEELEHRIELLGVSPNAIYSCGTDCTTNNGKGQG